MTVIFVVPVSAQQVHSYKTVARTVYERKPVTVTKWVNETVMEKQTVTSQKLEWQSETRQRYKTEYKPVRKTGEREERTVVRKPVVETRFRKKETRQTTYETITEMRDEQYTVRKPVIETQMREETVTVRKPVTEQLIEVQRTTSYRPVLKNTTSYVPQNSVVMGMAAAPDPDQRARIRRLDAGYYTDPATGATIYRRRGLHWVQPMALAPVASTVPVMVPQVTGEWSYVPETTVTRKPVEVTRFVEQTETRRVPVEIQHTVESVETRKVPVTVQIPKTTILVEEVPYTETTYKDEVVVKKVPYSETTYQKVETVEPYTVQVQRWVPETKEIEVPRTVQKRVQYEVMQDVPRTVLFRIPLDDCGNEIGPAVQLDSEAENSPSLSSQDSPPSTTTSRRLPATDSGKSVLVTNPESENANYQGELKLVPKKKLDETSERMSAGEKPESGADGSKTKLQRIPDSKGTDSENGEEESESNVDPATKPPLEPSESGDENAAERPPVPRDPKDDVPSTNEKSDRGSESDDDDEKGDLRTVVAA